MHQRWLIRTCFLIPVILFASLWLMSIQNNARISYMHVGYEKNLGTFWGVIWFGWGQDVSFRPVVLPPDSWQMTNMPMASHILSSEFMESKPYLGFAYNYRESPSRGHVYEYRALAIPIWFPLSMATASFLLVFRKTRPKPNPKTAFPIEPTNPSLKTPL